MSELSNKLNVRVQGVHNDKIINRIKHNLRHIRANSKLNDNNEILIDIHSNKSFEFMSKKSDLSSRMYKYFSAKYRTDRKKHNEKFKASQKRSVRDYHGSWAEGVLTFSEAIHKDLGTEYSQEDLIEAAKKMLLEFESKWETEVTFMCLHLSEKTPHFHFFFKNFDEHGKSITFKNRRREELSQLQDLMFKHFKELGMERGIKKADSGCGTVDYSKPKHEELIAEIETLKSEVKDLKLIRKSVTADVDKSKQEKKQIYSDITKVQKQKREEIKSLKEEAFKYSQKSLQIKQNYQNRMTQEKAQKIVSKNTDTVSKSDHAKAIKDVEFVKNEYRKLNDRFISADTSRSRLTIDLKDTRAKLKKYTDIDKEKMLNRVQESNNKSKNNNFDNDMGGLK